VSVDPVFLCPNSLPEMSVRFSEVLHYEDPISVQFGYSFLHIASSPLFRFLTSDSHCEFFTASLKVSSGSAKIIVSHLFRFGASNLLKFTLLALVMNPRMQSESLSPKLSGWYCQISGGILRRHTWETYICGMSYIWWAL
jgi:hypothetical protein